MSCKGLRAWTFLDDLGNSTHGARFRTGRLWVAGHACLALWLRPALIAGADVFYGVSPLRILHKVSQGWAVLGATDMMWIDVLFPAVLPAMVPI